MTVPPTLLCTVSFPANTGFAWDFIEGLYARMASELAKVGVRTLVAYPVIRESPRTLAGTAATPVVLDTRLHTWKARFAMTRFVRRQNVKVVYLTDRPLWSFSYALLRLAGVQRIIVHDHTSGVRTASKGLRREMKRFVVNMPGVGADIVIAVSDYVARRDRVVGLVSARKIRRIWNGLDPVSHATVSNGPDIRNLLKLSPDTAVIACACRATPEKGVDVLFRAFEEFCASSQLTCVLVYVGDGPELQNLTRLRDSLACGERIHLLGYLPSASDLLRTATVCVVPSVWEDAFPLAVLETMARGRAVVATRVGGVPEMIEDGVSGVLVPPNDAAALAHALATLVPSTSLQDTYGNAARVRVSRLFTAERQISEMLETFRHVFP